MSRSGRCSARPGAPIEEYFPHVAALRDRTDRLVGRIRRRLVDSRPATAREFLLCENLVLFLLYLRCLNAFAVLVAKSLSQADWDKSAGFWDQFAGQFHLLSEILGRPLPSRHFPEVIFAGFFQIERAFTHIFERINWGSMPVAWLRTSVWESRFTRDLRRYILVLHGRMSDLPTLIVGPSGSGKELVAGAIGMSCCNPFRP
jgi:hypothetical protein